MVPAANTIGFAGQELARKMPKVLGVIMETTLGSLVEIILFTVLVVRGDQNIREYRKPGRRNGILIDFSRRTSSNLG